MLLNVLSRDGDGCRAMQQLIARSHESPKQKQAHIKRGWQLFRSLVERGLLRSWSELSSPARNQRSGAVRTSRPTNRSETSRERRAAGRFLDGPGRCRCICSKRFRCSIPKRPNYALDLITLVESILEDPDIMLRKQLDRVKDQKMAEMKMEGVEYQERMDELEKLEYPKPNREFVYSTFNAFADRHPWVGQENIRPKSIAREMFEQFRSFAGLHQGLRTAARGGRAAAASFAALTKCWRKPFPTPRRTTPCARWKNICAR